MRGVEGVTLYIVYATVLAFISGSKCINFCDQEILSRSAVTLSVTHSSLLAACISHISDLCFFYLGTQIDS